MTHFLEDPFAGEGQSKREDCVVVGAIGSAETEDAEDCFDDNDEVAERARARGVMECSGALRGPVQRHDGNLVQEDLWFVHSCMLIWE